MFIFAVLFHFFSLFIFHFIPWFRKKRKGGRKSLDETGRMLAREERQKNKEMQVSWFSSYFFASWFTCGFHHTLHPYFNFIFPCIHFFSFLNLISCVIFAFFVIILLYFLQALVELQRCLIADEVSRNRNSEQIVTIGIRIYAIFISICYNIFR